MSAKNTSADLINQLDDNASWSEVKNTIMKVYKRETGDARADSIAAIILCAVFVAGCIFWVSSR